MIKVKIKNNSSQQTSNYQKRKGPPPQSRQRGTKEKNELNPCREQNIGSRQGGDGGLDKADHQDNSPHCGAMKILHNSAQSLIKKINELNILAFDIQPVIICVSETLKNA